MLRLNDMRPAGAAAGGAVVHAEANGEVGPVRASTIERAGRILAVLLPVGVATALVGNRSALSSVLATMILTLVWYVCINAGFAASRTTLATLGPRIAVLRGSLLALVVMTALGVWRPGLAFGVGASLALAAATFLFVAGWETVVDRRLRASTRLLLVGPPEQCSNVIRALAYDRRFNLVGIVHDNVDEPRSGPLAVGRTTDLEEIVWRVRPDLVALAPGCNRPEAFTRLLDSAAAGFRVLELAQFYEYAFGRVPVHDLTRAWFMSVLHLYQRPYSRFAKRSADLVGATLLAFVALPVFPVLVVLVRFSGSGPLFLSQVRVGEHGQLFTMYKFRTMRSDAERPGEAVWAVKDDPRVTGPGRVMRRLRLDELPQIWNVFKGEMSIVGPRPERPEFIDELLEAVPFWARRHLVKPGITGWAQVMRGYTADAEGSAEKLSYDLWYIRHRSLTVDIAICARTLTTVLRGEVAPAPSGPSADELDPITTLLGQVSGTEGTQHA